MQAALADQVTAAHTRGTKRPATEAVEAVQAAAASEAAEAAALAEEEEEDEVPDVGDPWILAREVMQETTQQRCRRKGLTFVSQTNVQELSSQHCGSAARNKLGGAAMSRRIGRQSRPSRDGAHVLKQCVSRVGCRSSAWLLSIATSRLSRGGRVTICERSVGVVCICDLPRRP